MIGWGPHYGIDMNRYDVLCAAPIGGPCAYTSIASHVACTSHALHSTAQHCAWHVIHQLARAHAHAPIHARWFFLPPHSLPLLPLPPLGSPLPSHHTRRSSSSTCSTHGCARDTTCTCHRGSVDGRNAGEATEGGHGTGCAQVHVRIWDMCHTVRRSRVVCRCCNSLECSQTGELEHAHNTCTQRTQLAHTRASCMAADMFLSCDQLFSHHRHLYDSTDIPNHCCTTLRTTRNCTCRCQV